MYAVKYVDAVNSHSINFITGSNFGCANRAILAYVCMYACYYNKPLNFKVMSTCPFRLRSIVSGTIEYMIEKKFQLRYENYQITYKWFTAYCFYLLHFSYGCWMEIWGLENIQTLKQLWLLFFHRISRHYNNKNMMAWSRWYGTVVRQYIDEVEKAHSDDLSFVIKQGH